MAEWKPVMPSETTQLFGTLIVVYGIARAPIGWRLAILVWIYTILSFFVVKIVTYRLLGHLIASHARHLARIEGHVAA